MPGLCESTDAVGRPRTWNSRSSPDSPVFREPVNAGCIEQRTITAATAPITQDRRNNIGSLEPFFAPAPLSGVGDPCTPRAGDSSNHAGHPLRWALRRGTKLMIDRRFQIISPLISITTPFPHLARIFRVLYPNRNKFHAYRKANPGFPFQWSQIPRTCHGVGQSNLLAQ
jgi:hypothetical protein